MNEQGQVSHQTRFANNLTLPISRRLVGRILEGWIALTEGRLQWSVFFGKGMSGTTLRPDQNLFFVIDQFIEGSSDHTLSRHLLSANAGPLNASSMMAENHPLVGASHRRWAVLDYEFLGCSVVRKIFLKRSGVENNGWNVHVFVVIFFATVGIVWVSTEVLRLLLH